MAQALWVGGGGCVGALARYYLAGAVHRWLPPTFPFGTAAVNVLGCFAIGWLGVLAGERAALGPDARLFLMVGVLGGFTTFSTFGYETLALFEEGSTALALTSAVGQVVVGLGACWLGAALARGLA